MIKNCWLLCIIMISSLLSAQTSNGTPKPKGAMKWNTTGFKQANSMGGGEAAIPKSGKFRTEREGEIK